MAAHYRQYGLGVETPMTPSDEFLSLDEDGGGVKREADAHPALNRYSVVCLDDPTPGVLRVSDYPVSLLQQLPNPHWLFIWINNRGVSGRVRFRVSASQRRTEGWLVSTLDCFGAAIFPLGSSSPPEASTMREPLQGLTLAVAGDQIDAAAFLDPQALPSLSFSAANSRIYPSEQMLDWLVRRQLSMCYVRDRGQANRSGFVILTPHVLDLDQLGMPVSELRTGTAAPSLWQ